MAKLIGNIKEIESQEDSKSNAKMDKAELQQKTSALPGRVEAESDIQARPDSVQVLKNDYRALMTQYEKDPSNNLVEKSLKKKIWEATKVGIDVISVPAQRAVSAIAGPAYELQDMSNPELGMDATKAFFQGISGKRNVGASDLYKSALPEMKIGDFDVRNAVSVIGGISTELGLGLKLNSSVNTALKPSKNALKVIERTFKVAKETKDAVGKSIGKLFAGKIGNKVINPLQKIKFGENPEDVSTLLEVFNGLPKGLMGKILGDPSTYKVKEKIVTEVTEKIVGFGNKVKKYKKVKTGMPEVDAENIWNFRKALDDMITEGEFAKGATTLVKQNIKHSANVLRSALVSVDKKVAPLMDEFSNYSAKFSSAKKYFANAQGEFKVNMAANALKRQGEAGVQKSIQEFANLFPDAAKMVKSLKTLNRSRAIDKAIKFGIYATIGSKMLKDTSRSISESIEPSTPSAT